LSYFDSSYIDSWEEPNSASAGKKVERHFMLLTGPLLPLGVDDRFVSAFFRSS
jgi:hypothetical protein